MLSAGGGLLAKIFAMLLMTLCPQQRIVANVAYTPSAKAPAGGVCAVRLETLDPISGEVLGEQDVTLTKAPQQVLIEMPERAACGLIRVVVTKLEGCTEPTGLRGMSLEVLDSSTGDVLRTTGLQVE
jgi:hypothetical protein